MLRKLTLGSGYVASTWPGMSKEWRVHGSYFFSLSFSASSSDISFASLWMDETSYSEAWTSACRSPCKAKTTAPDLGPLMGFAVHCLESWVSKVSGTSSWVCGELVSQRLQTAQPQGENVCLNWVNAFSQPKKSALMPQKVRIHSASPHWSGGRLVAWVQHSTALACPPRGSVLGTPVWEVSLLWFLSVAPSGFSFLIEWGYLIPRCSP